MRSSLAAATRLGADFRLGPVALAFELGKDALLKAACSAAAAADGADAATVLAEARARLAD